MLMAVAALLTLSAGCADDEGGSGVASLRTTTSGSAATDQGAGPSLEKYQECLREHGVELQGGDLNEDGTVRPPSGQANDPAELEKATRAAEQCKHLLPSGGVATNPDPAMLDQQRAWARCMREKGYDVPDPAPDGSNEVALPNSPELDKDMAACNTQAYGGS
ncbi:MAG TPA: hypothetical protein VGD67_22155 [Pseudonocardiaceae bacterium]